MSVMLRVICAQCGKPFFIEPRREGRARFCSYECRGKGTALEYLSDAWLARYWDRVEKTDDCWPWKGAKTTRGYGTISARGKTMLAHRVAWEIANGSPPGEMDVCHTCDNTSCVNPNHLFLGDARANMGDMDSKGRRVNANERITAEIANDIRARYAVGGVRQKDLAEEFGLSQPAISDVLRNQTWRTNR
jgi:hypothetical protein